MHSNDRPTFEKIYMTLATMFAERSSCARLQVGAVVTNLEQTMVLSVGYNGNYRGGPNCCDRKDVGNCGCIHAEANCLIKLNSKGYEKKILYVTHLPCPMCAKMIVNKGGFVKIYYGEDYRVEESKEIFKNSGIEVIKWQA
jgi:dCMP deaminase